MRRKPIAELKFQGTYNSTRHKNRELEELFPVCAKDASIPVPRTLTRKYVQEAYRATIENLKTIGVLANADLPLLEQAHIILQELRNLNEKIAKNEYEDRDEYHKDVATQIKLSDKYHSIAKDFFITPQERTKLVLTAKKDKREENKLEALLSKVKE